MLSQDEFIEKANKLHNYKYDYSKSVYLGHTKDVEIVCKDHGSFIHKNNIRLYRISFGENIISKLNSIFGY